MADRILVRTEEMNATISRFEQARATLDEAFTGLNRAKEHLDRCYKGPAYLALAAKFLSIYGNVKSAEEAIDASVNGLKKTISGMGTAEGNVGSTVTSADTGSGAKTYL